MALFMSNLHLLEQPPSNANGRNIQGARQCDETKPNCMRCTHGQRECTWPEGVPARKKTVPRKESPNALEGRPSTASSSASSTPPTRDPTPPRCIKSEDLVFFH
ncbi:hypothetical protein JOM56_001984 [Amanita muscaria]